MLDFIHAEDIIVFIATPAVPRPVISLKGGPTLNVFRDGGCRFSFRFWRADVFRLFKGLHLHDVYKLPSRVRAGGMEWLCLMLRRLAYPGWYGDLGILFGRSPNSLCFIFRYMVNIIYSK
ncbi:hypothetical protein PR003_g11092 [Phytophthora rubi]|uniref:DDE Tnp4 domain-containing protein n=1 Tax=Phytophthora rubi TaxID=129364 RepID=A0A6A3KU09_9STRA|nr:hypothetical protein PR001_g16198 [Phytophthora rubi]KAE9339293.1 hypothetical protein PR003_g11092 [Phytophthora rubi]